MLLSLYAPQSRTAHLSLQHGRLGQHRKVLQLLIPSVPRNRRSTMGIPVRSIKQYQPSIINYRFSCFVGNDTSARGMESSGKPPPATLFFALDRNLFMNTLHTASLPWQTLASDFALQLGDLEIWDRAGS